jgi:hypothetical protein
MFISRKKPINNSPPSTRNNGQTNQQPLLSKPEVVLLLQSPDFRYDKYYDYQDQIVLPGDVENYASFFQSLHSYLTRYPHPSTGQKIHIANMTNKMDSIIAREDERAQFARYNNTCTGCMKYMIRRTGSNITGGLSLVMFVLVLVILFVVLIPMTLHAGLFPTPTSDDSLSTLTINPISPPEFETICIGSTTGTFQGYSCGWNDAIRVGKCNNADHCECEPGWTHDSVLVLMENCGMPVLFLPMMIALTGFFFMMNLFYIRGALPRERKKLIKMLNSSNQARPKVACGGCITQAVAMNFILDTIVLGCICLVFIAAFMVQMDPNHAQLWNIVSNVFIVLTLFFNWFLLMKNADAASFAYSRDTKWARSFGVISVIKTMTVLMLLTTFILVILEPLSPEDMNLPKYLSEGFVLGCLFIAIVYSIVFRYTFLAAILGQLSARKNNLAVDKPGKDDKNERKTRNKFAGRFHMGIECTYLMTIIMVIVCLTYKIPMIWFWMSAPLLVTAVFRLYGNGSGIRDIEKVKGSSSSDNDNGDERSVIGSIRGRIERQVSNVFSRGGSSRQGALSMNSSEGRSSNWNSPIPIGRGKNTLKNSSSNVNSDVSPAQSPASPVITKTLSSQQHTQQLNQSSSSARDNHSSGHAADSIPEEENNTDEDDNEQQSGFDDDDDIEQQSKPVTPPPNEEEQQPATIEKLALDSNAVRDIPTGDNDAQHTSTSSSSSNKTDESNVEEATSIDFDGRSSTSSKTKRTSIVEPFANPEEMAALDTLYKDNEEKGTFHVDNPLLTTVPPVQIMNNPPPLTLKRMTKQQSSVTNPRHPSLVNVPSLNDSGIAYINRVAASNGSNILNKQLSDVGEEEDDMGDGNE